MHPRAEFEDRVHARRRATHTVMKTSTSMDVSACSGVPCLLTVVVVLMLTEVQSASAITGISAKVPVHPPPAPFGLRLEHLASPVLGVESSQPQLSWKLTHPQRGTSQAAYEIAVRLVPSPTGSAPLWASGKRVSNESEAIALFVSPAWRFAPETTYSVAVRWWQATSDAPSAFSSPLIFVTAPPWARRFVHETSVSVGTIRAKTAANMLYEPRVNILQHAFPRS